MDRASKAGVHMGDTDPLEGLRAGVVIDGKYRVDRILGRGGMGVVVAATHLALDERVALKFLRTVDWAVQGDFHARFAREARVCAKLKNEHIARVHDIGAWQGTTPYMVMDYVEGIELRQELKTLGRIPVARAIDLAFQTCEALSEAHARGIVHRDLKPANLILTARPDGSELVKVLDFGVSKWTATSDEFGELTKAGVMLGSPRYMAPEQLEGGTIDARADVWAIGAILYTMLTGRPPHDFPQLSQMFLAIVSGATPLPPSVIDPAIPRVLDLLVLRCLAHDRERRPSSVDELAAALQSLGGGASPNSTAKHLALVVDSAAPMSLSESRASTFTPRRHARRLRTLGRSIVAMGAVVAVAVGVARAPVMPGSGGASAWVLRTAPRTKSVAPVKTLAPELETSLVIEMPAETYVAPPRWQPPPPGTTFEALMAAIAASAVAAPRAPAAK